MLKKNNIAKKQFESVRIDTELAYIVIDGIQCYVDVGDDIIIENKLNNLFDENRQLKQKIQKIKKVLKCL